MLTHRTGFDSVSSLGLCLFIEIYPFEVCPLTGKFMLHLTVMSKTALIETSKE